MDPITFNYDESLFQGSIENPKWTTANLGSSDYAEDCLRRGHGWRWRYGYRIGMNNDNIAWWENDGNAEPSWQVHYLPHNLDTGSNLGASHVHELPTWTETAIWIS